MPNDMTQTKDTARAELLAQADAALARRVPAQSAAPISAFLRRWAEGLTTTELAERTPEDIAGAALSLWEHAQQRAPGQANVRVFNPRGLAAGWRSPYAVAEIVTDDMPFLVDSALGALTRLDLPMQTLVHPVLPVRRDAAGQMQAVEAGGAPESMMQIGFGPEADSAKLAEVAAALKRAMTDVRAAVGDFDAMAARLKEAEAALAEGSAEREFLGWLAGENFVLTGFRAFHFENGAIVRENDANLGVLRNPDIYVFDVMRDESNVPVQLRTALLDAAQRVVVAKANMRSTVHRPQHCDVVIVKLLDADGAVGRCFLFLGLFAAAAYNRNPRSIPILREKVARILALAGVQADSHDGRALTNILDTWPRDELFQADDEQILTAARGVLSLQVRPRVALFLRPDPFGRFVSALAYVPRDRFDTRLRQELGTMIARAYEGRLSTSYVTMGDGPLARVLFIIATTPGKVPVVDTRMLERALAQASRSFRDRLSESLATEHGAADGARVLARWGDAFPGSYAERYTASGAVQDIRLAERALEEGALQLSLERPGGAPPSCFALKLYNPGGTVALSDIVPLIETLGLRVLEEIPHELQVRDARPLALQVLKVASADGSAIDLGARGPALLEALSAIWEGRAEADGFNRLVLRAGLTWREAWLLRAMFKWCRQVGFPFSQGAVEDALSAHPEAARWLIDTFNHRFDPEDEGAEDEAAWAALLDRVENPDEDRILRRLRTLLDAVLRTNFWQDGGGKPYLSLKIDSPRAGEMPLPRPMAEIWVHGARMEGCHLRGGKVARGGIRWSDRREDFRTEILGLMKAQMVKNVVIVPVGAKGGFVLKRPPAPTGDAARDREANQAEGIACYRMLIQGMLDVTDNLKGQEIVPPASVRRQDGDDPYIVAAADKGTAKFSDIANGIAGDYGFWLGDAFASGGSKGYDHKGMGITARGAWVNIARHFREMGVDIQRDLFTCAGVGDMSGDVFGNGLLVSRRTRLVCAFDHRHIFIDPDPDPDASFDERARLFALPRSSWADYDAAKLSAGGGIYPRSAKTIALSPQARALLDIEGEHVEPVEVLRAILHARVDLLYFGGIGTYLKASTESQAAAGDRANDAIRADARDLRCKVVGEGANLGVTQAARVEAATAGIRLNTDALDNSAGVSTSDHEVNIKILLADAMGSGELTEKQRVDLLAEMTDEVANLVLRDNYQQSQAISLDVLDAVRDVPAQISLMALLEAHGSFDRVVAGMPDAATLSARAAGLTRPEAATLFAHTKLWLAGEIDDSALPDDPACEGLVFDYFPTPLRTRFPAQVRRHQLRKELIGTALTNELVNRMGAAAFGRLVAEGGAPPPDAAKAAWVAWEAFDLAELCARIEALDGVVPAAAQLAGLDGARTLQEAAARLLLGSAELARPIADLVATLRPGLAALARSAAARAAGSPQAQALAAQGMPPELAALIAALPSLAAAPAIVRLAAERDVPVEQAEAAWRTAGEAFAIEALRSAVDAAPATGKWGARAGAAMSDDLTALQGGFAGDLLAAPAEPATLLARLGPAATRAVSVTREAAATPDLAAASVAARLLRALRP